MEGVSKTQQRVLTVAGVVVGIVVGFIVFRRAIADKEGVLEIGDFVLGVFIGGGVGIILYTLIKDGIPRLLNRRTGEREPKAPRERPARVKREPAPTPTPTPTEPVKERRKEPLRAAGRERPLRSERPLKPRD